MNWCRRLRFLILMSSGKGDVESAVLESSWNRAYWALRDGLELYRVRNPGTYATVIIDEPTACFAAALSLSDTKSDLASCIISDLVELAVYYSCDKPTARLIFASSSASVGMLGTLLSKRMCMLIIFIYRILKLKIKLIVYYFGEAEFFVLSCQ